MWVFGRERTWVRVRVEFQFPGVDPIKRLLVAENDQEPRFQEIPPRKSNDFSHFTLLSLSCIDR